jgi:hypothetical protein
VGFTVKVAAFREVRRVKTSLTEASDARVACPPILLRRSGFGNADHAVIGGGPSTSSIAGIRIGGAVAGSAVGGDHFGFVSHQIASFRAAGVSLPLSIDRVGELFNLSPPTGDVTLLEI